jgi:hypothetical protein
MEMATPLSPTRRFPLTPATARSDHDPPPTPNREPVNQPIPTGHPIPQQADIDAYLAGHSKRNAPGAARRQAGQQSVMVWAGERPGQPPRPAARDGKAGRAVAAAGGAQQPNGALQRGGAGQGARRPCAQGRGRRPGAGDAGRPAEGLGGGRVGHLDGRRPRRRPARFRTDPCRRQHVRGSGEDGHRADARSGRCRGAGRTGSGHRTGGAGAADRHRLRGRGTRDAGE